MRRPDESDQRPGPFAVSSLPTSGLQIRGGVVDVAPHDVFYDETRQLWYCDVEIGTGAAYFPFIRLALARYQPTSSPNAHLSGIVLSDIIAVTPDRWLNVTPASDTRSARVALFGVGYDESSGHREASKAPSSVRIDPATGLIEMVAPASVAGRTVVEVSLERFDPRRGEDFGWQRVDNALVTQRLPQAATQSLAAVTLQSLFGSAAAAIDHAKATTPVSRETQLTQSHITDRLSLWNTLWEGDVGLPDDGSRYRLVVAEYEEYLVDDTRPYDTTPTQKGRRIVFIEHVELG